MTNKIVHLQNANAIRSEFVLPQIPTKAMLMYITHNETMYFHAKQLVQVYVTTPKFKVIDYVVRRICENQPETVLSFQGTYYVTWKGFVAVAKEAKSISEAVSAVLTVDCPPSVVQETKPAEETTAECTENKDSAKATAATGTEVAQDIARCSSDEERLEVIKKDLAAGLSESDISKKYKIHWATIRRLVRLCKQEAAETETTEKPNEKREAVWFSFTDADRKQLVLESIKSGGTLETLAKDCEVSVDVIQQFCYNHRIALVAAPETNPPNNLGLDIVGNARYDLLGRYTSPGASLFATSLSDGTRHDWRVAYCDGLFCGLVRLDTFTKAAQLMILSETIPKHLRDGIYTNGSEERMTVFEGVKAVSAALVRIGCYQLQEYVFVAPNQYTANRGTPPMQVEVEVDAPKIQKDADAFEDRAAIQIEALAAAEKLLSRSAYQYLTQLLEETSCKFTIHSMNNFVGALLYNRNATKAVLCVFTETVKGMREHIRQNIRDIRGMYRGTIAHFELISKLDYDRDTDEVVARIQQALELKPKEQPVSEPAKQSTTTEIPLPDGRVIHLTININVGK